MLVDGLKLCSQQSKFLHPVSRRGVVQVLVQTAQRLRRCIQLGLQLPGYGFLGGAKRFARVTQQLPGGV